MHNTLDNDRALIHRIAEGDEAAFSILYNDMLPTLHGFLLKMLKTEEPVKEVIQETYIRVWLKRDQLPEIMHIRTWITKVALNECYRLLRKNGLREQLPASQEGIVINAGTDQLSLKETHQIIQSAIQRLPARRRLIYTMSRERGLKIPEIGAELGLSPNYVKKALVLALQQIRQELAKAGKIISLVMLWKIF